MSERHKVLVLRKENSGESFLKLHLLGPELGCQLCLKRLALKKTSTKAAPDLFDTAEVQIAPSKQGTAYFINDYQVIRRRSEIGHSYRTLNYASNLSKLLVLNGALMADLPTLYRLTERSMDAFADRSEPSVVYLKALFLLLKEEGFPVRESWWPEVPAALRQTTRKLIAEPSPAKLPTDLRDLCEASIHNLMLWMRRETEMTLPDEMIGMRS